MTESILLYTFAGNTIKDYIYFCAFIIAGFLAVKIFRYVIFNKLKRLSERTVAVIDDLVIETFRQNLLPVMYLVVLKSGTEILNINSKVADWIRYIFLILIAFFVTRFMISVIIYSINRFWLAKTRKEDERSSIAVLLATIIKIIVWSVSLLILLDNMGVRVSGLVAGLGVGGVAIAFAAQSILGDVFNYFTIFFDRPFEIGDFLVVDNFAGVVEHIGVKTTRLRSLSGEQLIFANTDLTGSRVRNYKTMQERRVVFSFGVTYQTPAAKVKKISGEVQKIIESIEGTRFDRAHFLKFGDSSLDYEVVYYVLSGDYKTYMDIQQEINFQIMMKLQKMKIEFAYPTRTLFIEK